MLAAGVPLEEKNSLDALQLAILQGSTELIRTLVDAGIPLNREARFARTPLMAATKSRGNNIEILQLLLEAGADPNITNRYGGTVLMTAATSKVPRQNEMIKELLARGASLPTAEQWNQLTPSGKVLIKQYIPTVKQRRAVVSEWLEQKNLPTDLVRLVQKIGEELPSAQTQAIYDDVEDVE